MKYFNSIAFLLLLPLFVGAQEGTTLEEYRYLSKGYAYQQEMGLDASKAGYSIRPTFQASNEVKVVGMFKSNQTSPQALLFVIDQKNGKSHYICLPNNAANERVNELYTLDQRNLIQTEVKQKYQMAMKEYLFASLGQSTPSNNSIPSAYDVSITNKASNPTETAPQEVLTSKGIPDVSSYFPKTATSSANTSIPNAQSPSRVNTSADIKVGGRLSERALSLSPTITKAYSGKGKVVIKICVDQNGSVTHAKFTQRGSTTFNANLKALALNSARESRFANSDMAEQCGTIAYHFK